MCDYMVKTLEKSAINLKMVMHEGQHHRRFAADFFMYENVEPSQGIGQL